MAKTDKSNIELHILEPRATEKTYGEQTKRIYVFSMPLNASKQAIKKQVEEEFHVTVTDVNVLTRKGKATRFSRGKHAYPGTTYRRDHKYAYVKLKEGDSIKVFEEQEDNNNTSAKDTAKADDTKKKGLFSRKKADAEDKNAGKENK